MLSQQMRSCDGTKVEAVVVTSPTGQLNTDTPSIAVINYDIQPRNKETQNQPLVSVEFSVLALSLIYW